MVTPPQYKRCKMNLISLLSAVLLLAPRGVDAFLASPRLAPMPQVQRTSTSVRSKVTSRSNNNLTSNNAAIKTASSVGPLMLSSSGEDFCKIQGRKKRVVMGYRAMTALYIAVFLYSASKSIAPNTLLAITSYVAMPAGLSYILVGAAKHDRLGSDTYKRINLSLLEYAVLGLSVFVLSGGGNPILKVAYIITLINTIKGYAYGVLGLDKKSGSDTLFQDFMKGVKSTIKGICSDPKNMKSFGYWSATLMVASMKLLKLKEIVHAVTSAVAAKDIAMLLARFNRLSLLALMIYTLKDAADRDRLSGTTFIQLNYLCALVLGIVGVIGGVMTPLGGTNVAFAAFFAVNGLSSYFAKSVL
mmetsp:Transcript_19808/g.32479  ORF Transcript_19808/g.32479 Transcript_19808/m.32479 type:complete len:358 (+) Transcript_19808:15-1088(+)